MDFIEEPEKKIPVIAATYVLVVGGGPAGISAALASSREGVKTMLIERYGCLGGVITQSMIGTIAWYRYAKTVDAESVVMVIQCWDTNSEMVGFGTTQSSAAINGTTDWTQYSATVKVPTETQKIVIRLALTGTGQVWFDDITLEVK